MTNDKYILRSIKIIVDHVGGRFSKRNPRENGYNTPHGRHVCATQPHSPFGAVWRPQPAGTLDFVGLYNFEPSKSSVADSLTSPTIRVSWCTTSSITFNIINSMNIMLILVPPAACSSALAQPCGVHAKRVGARAMIHDVKQQQQ